MGAKSHCFVGVGIDSRLLLYVFCVDLLLHCFIAAIQNDNDDNDNNISITSYTTQALTQTATTWCAQWKVMGMPLYCRAVALTTAVICCQEKCQLKMKELGSSKDNSMQQQQCGHNHSDLWLMAAVPWCQLLLPFCRRISKCECTITCWSHQQKQWHC